MIAVDSSTKYDGFYNRKPVLTAADMPSGLVPIEVASNSNGLLALEVRVLVAITARSGAKFSVKLDGMVGDGVGEMVTNQIKFGVIRDGNCPS